MDRKSNSNIIENGRALASRALDLVFPPSLYCNVCGNYIDASRMYGLCDHCIRHIRWDRDPVKTVRGLKVMRCAEYGVYESRMIFALKYNGKKYIARDIARAMNDRLVYAGTDFDVIVPIPMWRGKISSRGFDHAVLISKFLGNESRRKVAADAIERSRETKPMRGLTFAERVRNVRDAFVPGADIDGVRGRRVLLVDDFYTTGSTAEECAKVLRSAGAADVVFLAFASRGMKKGQVLT